MSDKQAELDHLIEELENDLHASTSYMLAREDVPERVSPELEMFRQLFEIVKLLASREDGS